MALKLHQMALLKLLNQKLRKSNGVHVETLSHLFLENHQTIRDLQQKTFLKKTAMKKILDEMKRKKLIKKEGALYSVPQIDELEKIV